MHNKLNKILNGDRAEGEHILLADGASGRYTVAKGNSLFFKVERRNQQLGLLRVIAKMEDGDARLYASSIFEYPNYANNALKHSSMVVSREDDLLGRDMLLHSRREQSQDSVSVSLSSQENVFFN